MQHDLGEHVVSTLHVHLDHDHCLEVIVLRGPAALIQEASDRLLATKGVEHGKLVATAMPTWAAANSSWSVDNTESPKASTGLALSAASATAALPGP